MKNLMTPEDRAVARARRGRAILAAKEAAREARAKMKAAEADLAAFNAAQGPRCEVVSMATLARLGTWSPREVFRRMDEERLTEHERREAEPKEAGEENDA